MANPTSISLHYIIFLAMTSKIHGSYMELIHVRLEFERVTKRHIPASFESSHWAEWKIIKTLDISASGFCAESCFSCPLKSSQVKSLCLRPVPAQWHQPLGWEGGGLHWVCQTGSHNTTCTCRGTLIYTDNSIRFQRHTEETEGHWYSADVRGNIQFLKICLCNVFTFLICFIVAKKGCFNIK